jgi:hypothetical protein
MGEVEPNVIAGPEVERIIEGSLGELLLLLLKTHYDNILQVSVFNCSTIFYKIRLL